jgi:hypothetical protein
LEGIKNKIFKKEDVEKIAEERLTKCKACPHIDLTGKKCYVKGTAPCCGLCGCTLSLMTRSLSSSCSDEKNPQWEALVEMEDEILINKLEE